MFKGDTRKCYMCNHWVKRRQKKCKKKGTKITSTHNNFNAIRREINSYTNTLTRPAQWLREVVECCLLNLLNLPAAMNCALLPNVDHKEPNTTRTESNANKTIPKITSVVIQRRFFVDQPSSWQFGVSSVL